MCVLTHAFMKRMCLWKRTNSMKRYIDKQFLVCRTKDEKNIRLDMFTNNCAFTTYFTVSVILNAFSAILRDLCIIKVFLLCVGLVGPCYRL